MLGGSQPDLRSSLSGTLRWLTHSSMQGGRMTDPAHGAGVVLRLYELRTEATTRLPKVEMFAMGG